MPRLIFASRWLQLPLYLGLILAQGVYVFHFWVELVHLLEAVFGSQTALQALISSIGYKSDVQVNLFLVWGVWGVYREKIYYIYKNEARYNV